MIHKKCIFTLVNLPFYVVYGLLSTCLAIPDPLYVVLYGDPKTLVLVVPTGSQ